MDTSWDGGAGSREGWRIESTEHVHRELEEGADTEQRRND